MDAESELAQFFGAVKQEGNAPKRRRPQGGHRETRDYPRDQFQEPPHRESSLVISLARPACIAGRGDQGATPGPRTDLLHEARGAQHVCATYSIRDNSFRRSKPKIQDGSQASNLSRRRTRRQAGQGLPGGGFLPEGQGLGVEGSSSRLEVPVLEPGGSSSGGGQNRESRSQTRKWPDICKSLRSSCFFRIWCTASPAPSG